MLLSLTNIVDWLLFLLSSSLQKFIRLGSSYLIFEFNLLEFQCFLISFLSFILLVQGQKNLISQQLLFLLLLLFGIFLGTYFEILFKRKSIPSFKF